MKRDKTERTNPGSDVNEGKNSTHPVSQPPMAKQEVELKYKMRVTAILICLLVISGHSLFSQINYENTRRLNDGWMFLRQDLGSIWEAVRPSGKGTPESVPVWQEVVLPHCFNAEDAVDPDVNYHQGAGWYKTLLSLENPYPEGRTLLHFEGAGQKTEVYIYTEKVGTHIGGYDEWSIDITEAAGRFLQSPEAERFHGKIPLSVRCDNSRDTEMIPSDLSDFNLYGGIYRYLNLVYTPATAIEGIYIEPTVGSNGKKGKVTITTAIKTNEQTEGNITISIFSPGGKLLKREKMSLAPAQNVCLYETTLSNPQLWSPETPQLYTCEVTLTTPGGTMNCRDRFGFRSFEFVKQGPFLLNGKRLLLRGTHRHEDHAGVGAAMSEEQIIAEMKLMKAMGVNFIRLGHYQQSRIVLEACDRLGILVWEEIPWCRGGLGGATYREQARQMLTHMIIQHRNHPSVMIWGLGNENDWPNDFPHFEQEEIRGFMRELHNLAHKLDDSRLTAIRRCDFCKEIPDIYSPSIWAGWYRGIYTDYRQVSLHEMQQVDHFLHVEWGGDSHAGRHAENSYAALAGIRGGNDTADERAGDASMYGGLARASKDGDWSETYICDLIDWHLKEQENMEWLTGTAYWPFKDFSTPVRPENPVPYVNQKGVVERDLTPKESYYVFQSYWSEQPMIHIYGHSWPVRWGNPDEQKTIKVYSNCDEVELFLNDSSLGVRQRNSQDFPAAGLRWESAFREGVNHLRAVGRKKASPKQQEISDEISFHYETRPFGKEAALVVRITNIDKDQIQINAELVDNKGIVCLTSGKQISFESIGDGKLIVNQGTATGSKKVQATNGRASVRFNKNGGESRVAIRSEGLKTIFLEIK